MWIRLGAMVGQRLLPTDGGCGYESEQRFEGLLAPLVKLLAGGSIQWGFETVGADLAGALESP